MADEGERLRQWVVQWSRIGGIGIATALEFRRELLGLGIYEFEMHRGIILTGCLMDVDIETVITLHLE